MNLTKLEHACLVVAVGEQILVIDPGTYTRKLDGLTNVAATVVTHVHDDHCSEEQLALLQQTNPDLRVFGTAEVCQRLAKSMPDLTTIEVRHGDWHRVGAFELAFFGDLHQEIHRSLTLVQNCGVMVNDRLYFPGDSYTLPDQPIEWLACPTSAPWLKLGDVLDFVAEAGAQHVFPTHNALHSEHGNRLYNARVKAAVENSGGSFTVLEPGESVTLN